MRLESVEGHCRIVLASDAGGSLRVSPRGWRYGFWLRQLRRTLDMSLEVGRSQRRRALIDRASMAYGVRELSGTPHSEGVTEHVAPGWREYLATRPTRFWPMPESDRLRLVNWGYLTSDLVLRSYVPELHGAPTVKDLPYPGLDFSRPPA